jgi:hypothetical protein
MILSIDSSAAYMPQAGACNRFRQQIVAAAITIASAAVLSIDTGRHLPRMRMIKNTEK